MTKIQELRELLAKASPRVLSITESFPREIVCRDEIHKNCYDIVVASRPDGVGSADDCMDDMVMAHLFVAAINALPALLEVAEAAMAYRETQSHGELGTGRYLTNDRERLDAAIAKLEATK